MSCPALLIPRALECAVLATLWAGLAAPSLAQSGPASAPAVPPAPATQPAIRRVAIHQSNGDRVGEYWLRTPAGYAPGQRPVLIIALHGTDDTARQMIDFWQTLAMPVPVLLAAPQGQGKGWSEADLPTIRAMWADLYDRWGFDEQRVLLAGFSAGGAMTFELIYKEKLAATAAAALANYVSPRITADEVAARHSLPVFYAVGMTDVNQERMRAGLDFLRAQKANITIHRPFIGHTLDAGVAQKALDWFFESSRKELNAALDGTGQEENLAAAVLRLESITTQARWHEPAVAERAAKLLAAKEARGRANLRTAENLVAAGHRVEAAELLRGIEITYGRGRLAGAAQTRREQLESDPAVRNELARREAGRRAELAASLYATAQRLVAQNRHAEAAACCRQIASQYGDTPSAEPARRLLDLLQSRSAP